MSNNKLEVIAFYLPQFHPVHENDEWWGKGFTEWTNVAKAKPLFKGHNQPRIPADLGFYDLRVPEVREQQVELAKEAGVTAFCYWHYWFGNGRRLLERIFDEVLESGKPDFPFCLGWANHSWYAKTWDKNSIKKDKLLIEQTYPGPDDAREHFNYLLKAFNDHRYLKIDGKPFLFVFDPVSIPDEYLRLFREWTVEAGYSGLYLVGNIQVHDDKVFYIKKGFDAVLINRTHKAKINTIEKFYKTSVVNFVRGLRVKCRILDEVLKLRHRILSRKNSLRPTIVDFETYYKGLITTDEYVEDTIPQILPQWDHTPRSGNNGVAWINATPDIFKKHALAALAAVKDKETPLIMLKSWNEWGEGNYMEPDTLYGKGFIEALRDALNEVR